MGPKTGKDDQVDDLVDVWKAYTGRDYVLRGVNLKVDSGEFVAIVGRSGAGKTTLLRLVGLLDRPTRGKVVLFGCPTDGLSDKEASRIRLERIGFVHQSLNLIPYLTVRENIEVPMYLRGVPSRERRERALGLLERFRLRHLADRYPREVSMGEQQRVAVLRALANDPELVLADEPAAHLDEENAAALFELLRELNRELGTTVITSTTSTEEARAAERAYLLARGTLQRL